MSSVIYYRRSLMDKNELAAAQKYFPCTDLITNCANQFTIPRYSLYPFYLDQERELKNIGSSLINSHQQHRYIADLQNYVMDLKGLTPETWDNLEHLPDDCAFIVKGETNSKRAIGEK